MKIYIHGRDYLNWAIDIDNKNVHSIIDKIFPNCIIRNNNNKYSRIEKIKDLISIYKSDVIHSVYYEQLAKIPRFFLKNKKIIAHVTNEVDKNNKTFSLLRDYVDTWVCFSTRASLQLNEMGLKNAYNPIYASKNFFFKYEKSKKELAYELGIDYEKIKNKFIIGSFQKDSLSSNPTEFKWQKGPDILVEILKNVDNDKDILVLLAGPSRTWLINKLKENDIEYLYYGDENNIDDFSINVVNHPTINKLYNLIDLYIVSSRSEGGPLAISECLASNTCIISTNVGTAPDLLFPEFIYSTPVQGAEIVEEFIKNRHNFSGIYNKMVQNFDFYNSINSLSAQIKRLTSIYEELGK